MDYKRTLLTVLNEFGAEFLGTFIILFFGLGCNAAIYHGYLSGTWQAGIIWGIGVASAVLATQSISGAHLNPSITLGFAATFKLPLWKVPYYILAQVLGAFAAAALNYSFFTSLIRSYEQARGIVRGSPGSFKSAAIFVCTLNKDVTVTQAMYIEFCITAVLLLVVCVLFNEKANYGTFFPAIMVGLVVAILTGAFAPLTTCCLNSARDIGPRLLTLVVGWGSTAFPGEARNRFYPFLVGPMLGGIAGAWIYKLVIARMYDLAERDKELARKMSEEQLALVTEALANEGDAVRR